MWSIKFLSGPLEGQNVILQNGLIILGRDKSCEITIASSNISKKHAQIVVKDSSITIEDLNSTNGIFYKGKKIFRQDLKKGDLISIHDIIFEVKETKKASLHPYFQNTQDQSFTKKEEEENPEQKTPKKDLDFENMQKGLKGYLHNVILPGVYKLAEWLEFKWVITSFVILFIALVVTFSSIPLIQILKSSIEQEGKNHAESIALTLAQLNRKGIQKGSTVSLSVSYAQKRPGVKKAYIVHATDGRILAPAALAQTYPKDSFIHKARKQDTRSVKKLNSSTIASAIPINFYNPETGENAPAAYAIVYYDMGSLAVEGATIFSLLVQNLFIACLLGFILLFFLINLIEFPIRSINFQFNESLKDNKASTVSISYQSKILSELCDHINSALNQISLNQMLNQSQEQGLEENSVDVDKQHEVHNLLEIIGFPALSIDLENQVVSAVNSNFSEQLGYEEIVQASLLDIEDEEFKNHLQNLLEQGKEQPKEIAFGQIVLKNISIQTACQFIMGQNQPAYAVVIFMPAD